jgi:PAS domain-containing protein
MKDENKIKAELIKELKTLREERRESVINDITKRKQAEESLRESEAKYRAVLEQSADNIFLADLETKKILESNVSLRNLLGYSADEMMK